MNVSPAIPVSFAHERSDLSPDEDILYGVLPNGLRYAVRENDTPSKTATLLMRIDAGSLDESDETRGIAHFLEHMAFNGSKAIPEGEMIKRLERLGLAFGPDTNASTGLDQTTYQLELPDVTDALLDEALMIFRETAQNLTLDPDAIERERGIILAEKRARNSPAFRSQIASLEFQSEGTGLVESLPIGTEATIRSVTPQQFRDFYNQQYRPEDTFVVLVGDRPAEELAQKIAVAFEGWEAVGPSVEDAGLEVYRFDQPRFGAFFDPEVTTSLSMFTVQPVRPETERLDTAENRAERLPLAMATSMLNRRLAKRVRSGEAAYTGAGVGVSDLFDASEIASLRVSAERTELRPAFMEAERILRQALDHGFTQSELDEQIANARKSREVAVQTEETRRTPSLARQILGAFASERVVTDAQTSLDLFEAHIPEVTLESVNAALSEAFDAVDQAPQLFLQSDEVVDDVEAWLATLLEESRTVSLDPLEESILADFAYDEWGSPGQVESRTLIEDLDVTTVRFDNGVMLNIKPTPFEDDVVRMTARAGSGSAFYPQDEPAFGWHLAAVLGRSGLGAHTLDELTSLRAGKTAGVGRSFGLKTMTLSGATVPEDLEFQFDLLAAYLSDPGYREEVIAPYAAQVRSVWPTLDSTPGGAAGQEVPSLLSSNHWTDRYPSLPEALGVDIDALKAWYTENVDDGAIELSVVGDVDVDRIIDLTARTLGTLPERDRKFDPLPASAIDKIFPDGRAQPVEITHAGEPDTAELRVYWPVDDHADTVTDRRVGMLSEVLKLELNRVLREEEGATYSPSAFDVLPRSTPDWGYVGAAIEATPDELSRLTDVIEGVAERLAEDGVSDDVFDRAVKPVLEGIESNLESNGYWLGAIDEAMSDPETLDLHRERQSDYEQMTAEDVSRLARIIFDSERAIRVHVVPEG
ncbi:MAG: insulinase family protein [Litorimonas sp.]